MNPGDRFGSYTILSTLGGGGFATVYAAAHAQMGTRHALKVLHAHYAMNPKVVERFRQEARAQFRMRHKHIVQVTDFIEHGGALALVMDLIEGQTLAQVMLERRGPWPLAEVMAVMKPVLDAMAYAHREGIDGSPVVHRDLKPENVLLDFAGDRPFPGVPRVADFGIAKVIGESNVGTATNAKMGTPGYMAPEQFKNAKEVTAAADVWALGVMLWELLAGRLPVDPNDNIAIIKLYEGMVAVPRLVDVLPGVSPTVSAAVDQALRVDVRERFMDATPLARALSSCTRTGVGASTRGNLQQRSPAGRSAEPPKDERSAKLEALDAPGVASRHLALGVPNEAVTAAQIEAWHGVKRAAATWIDNHNATVTDAAHGLVWQVHDCGAELNWREARAYAAQLRLGGAAGWRLPTLFELLALAQSTANVRTLFRNSGAWYWSGSPCRGDGARVWHVSLIHCHYHKYGVDGTGRVRCVRDV